MSYTDKHIVDGYSVLFEGLSDSNKIGLIERLSISLKKKRKDKEIAFYKSFGKFSSELSAEEVIGEIKASRKFRRKDISF